MPQGTRSKRRRIAVITGTRAEYGLLRSTMAAIQAHPKLTLQVCATGMHLLPKFGRTVDRIIADGFSVDARVRMQAGDDQPLDQAIGLGRGISGIARFLESAKSDVVVVLGDRIEAMAGALAAVTTGRSLAHIHGGDVAAGDFDDPLRHAITKLANVHFTATASSTKRVLRMGKSPGCVHCVGAPGLDDLIELTKSFRTATVRERLLSATVREWRSGRALIVQHAYGRSAAKERRTMAAILRAVTAVGLKRTIVYPNSDRGHGGVIEAIEAHRRAASPDDVRVVRSLDRLSYLRELIEADVLVGNSSSGLIEAATAGTPSVNVGSRQDGREPAGPSVVKAEESTASIREAVVRALRKRPKIGTPTVYGTGQAGGMIATILAE